MVRYISIAEKKEGGKAKHRHPEIELQLSVLEPSHHFAAKLKDCATQVHGSINNMPVYPFDRSGDTLENNPLSYE